MLLPEECAGDLLTKELTMGKRTDLTVGGLFVTWEGVGSDKGASAGKAV